MAPSASAISDVQPTWLGLAEGVIRRSGGGWICCVRETGAVDSR